MLSTRLRKLASLALRPRLWPIVPYGVFPGLEHAPAFKGLEFDLIIDVGANKGQLAAFAAERWPSAHLICFEPLYQPQQKLAQVLSHVAPGRSEIRAKALGEEVGEHVMHVATREDSSSLLKLGTNQRELFNMEEARTEIVPVARLDDEPDTFGRGVSLLKIDVQGFEYEALVGAGDKLNQIDAVYVECSFVELYEGQKLADDVTSLLTKHGFSESGRFNICAPRGESVQADILFVRTGVVREPK